MWRLSAFAPLKRQLRNLLESEFRLRRDTAEKLNDFFGAFTGAGTPTLLLDFDGTLAPFRLDRFKARPWAEVRELLSRIQNQGRTRMAVITGRPAAEVVSFLGVTPMPEVWGLHGAERLHSDGRREFEHLSPSLKTKLDALAEDLERQTQGGLVERKPNAVAVHWRGVGPGRARAIEKRTRALFEPFAHKDGLSILAFEAGLELRTGRNKGEAVSLLLQETGDGESHPAAYLGDDITDEAAFRAIKGKGLGVLVRREWRETCASVWLRPPQELRDFLSRWLHHIAHIQSNVYDPLLNSRRVPW